MMSEEDIFGGPDDEPPTSVGGSVIPFPRLRSDVKVSEQWIRERDAFNSKASTSYRFRGPLDALDDLIRKRGLPSMPFPREWPELDKRCKLFPGELMAISGPSGGGKTSFAIQICRAAIGAGSPTCWLPLELDDVELNLRIVANMSATHTIRVREEWTRERIAHSLTAVSDRWRYVDRVRDPEKQVAAARAAVQISKRIHGTAKPPILVVDYIGKLARGARDPRLVLADAIEGFRDLAVAEECYVILLSQTSRGNNAVLTGKVDLENATDAIGVSAETGELEHAASVNIALNVFKVDDADALSAHILVTKARGTGREGRQGAEFSKPGGVWKELDHLPATPGEVTAEVRRTKRKDGPPTDPKVAKEDLNFARAAAANQARRDAVLDALKRAGLIGLGMRDLRKVRGAGNAQRLKKTLTEIAAAGDAVQLDSGRWRVIPK